MEDINSSLVYKSQVIKTIEEYRVNNAYSPSVSTHIVAIKELIEQIPELEVYPIKANIWNEYPKQKPEKSGEYLCSVIFAEGNGKYSKGQIVLGYQATIDEWESPDGIVAHWKELDDAPIINI